MSPSFPPVIHWLQTSLFGKAPEEPSPTRDATHPAVPERPLDAAFTARWERAVNGSDVTLELAPRLRQGWHLSWRRGGGAVLRAPKTFGAAPEEILGALGAWARLAMLRKSPARTRERRALEKTLHAWLEQAHAADGHVLKLKRGRAARKLERLNPKGHHHDLEAILAAVVAEYFPDGPEAAAVARARITWSARWGGLSTQSTAHDEQGRPYPLISISRGYDHATATPEIVGGVVYHECLHIVVPPQEVTETSSNRGRRVVHGREFRRREKLYRYYDVWRKWHAEKLPGIIRRGTRNEK